MDSTAKGNEFRSHVLALLQTKFKDAITEAPVSWKKADITFTGMDFGRRIKFAVECKHYAKKLTTSDFKSICMDYEAAFNKQEIQTLIIVSLLDIEAASRKLVDDSPRIRFMTYNQLEEWLIGLRGYIESIATEFSNDDVSEYYIEGRFNGYNEAAFEVLRAWIAKDEGNGAAVLGGYGLGKSSLAKRIAADQAKKYLSNPALERMPILLRLGQVVHETELSGLFGKEFTAVYTAEGYSFKTLMHLNGLGRLLIILDGFDEMKHAMTEADFRSNFREFNRLRTDKAKVLLLGRPSTFTSDSAELLIKGLNRLGGQQYVDEEFPAWEELILDFFSPDEGREFLIRFLAFSSKKRGEPYDMESIKARVEEILRDVPSDILRRPVQARIVGQLAASPSYSFKNINRFRLYDDFVERMIDRDQEKPARKQIPSVSRRVFLDELAWWAWMRGDTAQGVFGKDEVPQAIFDQLPNGDAIDAKAKRTEYLVSSLTEQKDSDVLYFAHRSFQEFLVASWISSRTDGERDLVPQISKALTQEVCGFLREVEQDEYLEHLYGHLSPRTRMEISIYLLLLMRRNASVVESLARKDTADVSIFDVMIVGYPDELISAYPLERLDKWLIDVVQFASNVASAAAFWCLLNRSAVDTPLFYRTLAAGWQRILSGISQTSFGDGSIIVDERCFGPVGEVLRIHCQKNRNMQGRRLTFDMDKAIEMLRVYLTQMMGLLAIPAVAASSETAGAGAIDSAKLEVFFPEELSKLYANIYSIKGDAFRLVSRYEKLKPHLVDVPMSSHGT